MPATFARTQNMRPRFFIQPVLNKTGLTTVRHNPGTKNPLLPPLKIKTTCPTEYS